MKQYFVKPEVAIIYCGSDVLTTSNPIDLDADPGAQGQNPQG